jgi:hypothetical protein
MNIERDETLKKDYSLFQKYEFTLKLMEFAMSKTGQADRGNAWKNKIRDVDEREYRTHETLRLLIPRADRDEFDVDPQR